MSATDLNAIIDRAAKLRALSQSSNVNEAALAAEKLQELLFKYNLAIADLDARHGTATGFVRDGVELGKGSRRFHREVLLQIVARYNFCKAVSVPRSNESIIVGQSHNITVVKHLYGYIHTELVRHCENGVRELPTPEAGSIFEMLLADTRTEWRDGFWYGALDTVDQRLKATQRQQTTEHPGGQALVADMEGLLQQALADLIDGRIRSKQASRPVSADGYTAGERAGNRVNLERPIGSGARRALRG